MISISVCIHVKKKQEGPRGELLSHCGRKRLEMARCATCCTILSIWGMIALTGLGYLLTNGATNLGEIEDKQGKFN